MVSRRDVLKLLGMGTASLACAPFFPKFYINRAFGQTASVPIFVSLYLGGGWDGCAVAQPASGAAYDACLAARPTLTKRPENLLMLSNELGLHPSWSFLQQAYVAGDLTVFPTAGIAVNPSGSHETASGQVIRGQYDGNKQISSNGFLAKILDTKYPNSTAAEFLAFDMAPGNSVLNESVNRVIKASNITSLGFNGGVTGDRSWTQDMIYLLTDGALVNDVDGKVRTTVKALEATQIRIERAIQNTTFNPAFPQTGIGSAFRQAFIAIANFADVGLEAIAMSTGGFDTHNNQDPTVAQGQALQGVSASFKQIDDALNAFEKNLKRIGMWNRVAVMTATDFGRTARENGSRGTDHGVGTTMFLLGGAVIGGQIVGSLVQPADFNRGNNSFPVSVPIPAIVAQISEKMGVNRGIMYPQEVLAALPPMPALFRA